MSLAATVLIYTKASPQGCPGEATVGKEQFLLPPPLCAKGNPSLIAGHCFCLSNNQ